MAHTIQRSSILVMWFRACASYVQSTSTVLEPLRIQFSAPMALNVLEVLGSLSFVTLASSASRKTTQLR